ncbi:DgyrCDS772 [Dimorphilus gyrociliatus]|uniref:DgyrCDS772 n=1 Tax=Dimorphilus gyrociliatus TaxID=2664684 RepID=A0A7I8V5C5_9ANNE|nr:DgyrCDS772 [Dimorphilus gyrociliatus]
MDDTTKKFWSFIKENKIEDLKKFLKRNLNFDINKRDEEGRTALLYSCQHQITEITKILLENKNFTADRNAEDKSGNRPIWFAVLNNDLETLSALFQGKGKRNKCECNYLDRRYGYSPFYKALINENIEMCKALVYYGADVNLRSIALKDEGESPLIRTVKNPNIHLVQLLLNSLVKINATAENGWTALHFAVWLRRYEFCQMLLEHGADKYAKTNSNMTPLSLAIKSGDAESVRLLCDYGTNGDKKFHWNETPLQMCLNLGEESCAMTLVRYGSKLNITVKEVAEKCLFILFRFLLDIKPTYQNEEWLRENILDWPLALHRRQTVQDFIKQICKNPRPLKILVRAKIFKTLGRFAYLKINHLQIDNQLKDYLAFNSYFPNEIYQRKKFLDENLPPIEVHSDESDTEFYDF